ncbi:hypothetical protein D3C72_2574960 [compost metagenome]
MPPLVPNRFVSRSNTRPLSTEKVGTARVNEVVLNSSALVRASLSSWYALALSISLGVMK